MKATVIPCSSLRVFCSLYYLKYQLKPDGPIFLSLKVLIVTTIQNLNFNLKYAACTEPVSEF